MSIQTDFETTATQLREGRVKAALKSAKAGLKRHKTHPAFPNFAGIAMCSLGQHRGAIPFFQKALKLAPDFNDARKNLAQALVELNEFQAASKVLSGLITRTPKDPQVWYLQALVQYETGELDAALVSIDEAISLDEKFAQALNLRGLMRNAAGKVADSIDDYRAAIKAAPNDVEILLNASEPLADQVLFQEATAALERAVQLAPDYPKARFWLSVQQLAMGETKTAREGFKWVLERDPEHATAIHRLTGLQSGAENKELLPLIERALKIKPVVANRSGMLNLAKARIHEQIGEPDKAVEAWAVANATLASESPYDSDADSAFNAEILGQFTGGQFQSESMPDGPRPIYVLGLPRSGTTLTENVIAAHSKVKGLGERGASFNLIGPLIGKGIAFDADAIADFVRQDRSLLPPLPDDAIAYVDKMPENYRIVGFLLAAYPDARIISVKRDPRDIGLSMWKASFKGKALNYIYDFKDMAHRFNLYAKSMQHWHSVFPGRIYDLQYEDMVQDVMATSQDIANFCDLEWEPAMARPDLSAEQVLTASVTQLRQPVHARSVGGWRKYPDMIQPLIDGLDPKLWPNLDE